jgi:hypothetical protein
MSFFNAHGVPVVPGKVRPVDDFCAVRDIDGNATENSNSKVAFDNTGRIGNL